MMKQAEILVYVGEKDFASLSDRKRDELRAEFAQMAAFFWDAQFTDIEVELQLHPILRTGELPEHGFRAELRYDPLFNRVLDEGATDPKYAGKREQPSLKTQLEERLNQLFPREDRPYHRDNRVVVRVLD